MVTTQIENDFLQQIVSQEHSRFLFINGTYGVGKTYLIEKILKRLKEFKFPYVVLFFQLEDVHRFVDLSNFLKVQTNLNQDLKTQILNDITFFRRHFDLLLNELVAQSKDSFLSQVIEEHYLCYDYLQAFYLNRNYPPFELEEFSKKISKIFKKNIDKRVLLYLFEIQAESIIAPIINLLIQNGNFEVKPLIMFVFDNYDKSAGTVDWWIYKILNSYSNKNLNDFIAYRINNGNFKVNELIDLKFILSSRSTFSMFKFKELFPETNFSVIKINPFKEDQLNSLEAVGLPHNCKNNDLLTETFGIFYNLLQWKELDFEFSSVNKKIKFSQNVYNKIAKKLSKPLIHFINNSWDFRYFGEEIIRYTFSSQNDHNRVIKYFLEEDEIFQLLSYDKQLFSFKKHYSNVLRMVLTQNQELTPNVSEIKEKFLSFYEKYGNFSPLFRQIIRSLEYFNEFDISHFFERIYGDDFGNVKLFVQNYPEFFYCENNIYRLKEEHKNALLEINQLIYGERYVKKIQLLKDSYKEFQSYLNEEINSLTNELQLVENQISNSDFELRRLESKKEKLFSKILTKQNELNLLRNKYLNIAKKNPAFIFVILVIFSFISFFLGNNLTHFFYSNFQNNFVGGLGIALKFVAIILFGSFLYLVINFLTNRTRSHQYANLKSEIDEIEKEINNIKTEFGDINNQIADLSLSIEENQFKKEKISKKILELQKSQQVKYIDPTQ